MGSANCENVCEKPPMPVVVEPMNLKASETCAPVSEAKAVESKEALPALSNVIPRSDRLWTVPVDDICEVSWRSEVSSWLTTVSPASAPADGPICCEIWDCSALYLPTKSVSADESCDGSLCSESVTGAADFPRSENVTPGITLFTTLPDCWISMPFRKKS